MCDTNAATLNSSWQLHPIPPDLPFITTTSYSVLHQLISKQITEESSRSLLDCDTVDCCGRKPTSQRSMLHPS